ncbi:protease inhibitor Inh/omp19 family protein [Stappia stellulata]|uniref:protease inhibitor Inh/omp19 family protein n=1 Tax=Stappia stellulata TaxID=71235 RepID=UPI0004217788|nr:protease inhibitor Inh/omp19 family protein [Stappia stellulata]
MIRTAPLRMPRLGTQMTAVVCLTLALAGCQRLGYGNRSAPLPATPTAPVASQSLEPLDPSLNPRDTQTLDGTAPLDGDTQVAGVDPLAGGPPAGAREIGRSDMLGGWSLASGADNCKLFMTLTTWEGGYRANSRGCATPTLQTVSAWDLQGKEVILKDTTGATVAQLYATGAERFSGRTTSGAPISVFR